MVAGELVGIAGAVEAFVAAAHELGGVRERWRGEDDPFADLTVWRRMNSHSSSSSGPGLSRIESGIAALPTSCSSAASSIRLTSCSGSPRAFQRSGRRGGRLRRVLARCRPGCVRQRTGAASVLAARGGSRGLVLVHALVGDLERVLGRGAVLGQSRHAVGAADREGFALLGQGVGSQARDRLAAVPLGRGEHAELVAADSVGAPGPGGARARAVAEDLQEAHRRPGARRCRCSA